MAARLPIPQTPVAQSPCQKAAGSGFPLELAPGPSRQCPGLRLQRPGDCHQLVVQHPPPTGLDLTDLLWAQADAALVQDAKIAALGLDWNAQPPSPLPMARRSPTVLIDKRRILHLLDDPSVTSLTKLYAALGGRGSIPGGAARRIRGGGGGCPTSASCWTPTGPSSPCGENGNAMPVLTAPDRGASLGAGQTPAEASSSDGRHSRARAMRTSRSTVRFCSPRSTRPM
jgi:hypothetical protein